MVQSLVFTAVLILSVFEGTLFLSQNQDDDVLHLEDAARAADVENVDFGNLFETNEGFRNLTYHGVPQKRGIISAATAGFGLLKGIAEQIDLSRVCVIGLSNNGNRKLTEPTWYLDSGIIKNPLPRVIPAGEAGIFTFEKTNYATFGTAGILTYTIEGTDVQIEVMWSVPFVYGINSNRLNIKIGRGETASEATFKLLYDNDFQEVSSGGHWMHRNLGDVKVHAAMTNNAKASLLVEVLYNITDPFTILGK